MATSSLVLKVACLLLVCMVMSATLAKADISCGQVQGSMVPCIQYLRGNGGPVPEPCCNGVRTLNNEAQTTPDRQAVCRCLQSAATSIPDLNMDLAASLPANCGVNVPYKISPSTNCDSVN